MIDKEEAMMYSATLIFVNEHRREYNPREGGHLVIQSRVVPISDNVQ